MLERGIITEAEAIERFGDIHKGLRELVEDVCLGNVRSAVAVANRGGGKSMGVSFVEFFLVFVKDFDALNLGGSELQADQVYQYILSYIESHPEFASMIKGETLISKTETVNNAWIRVLAASQKSVRSPHAGGRKKDGRMAGGILVIDEEAEAAPDIVSAALSTINTARPSVNVRCSTFHNAEGSFAEVVENHEDMGYEIYKWDIFDVAERCDCIDVCQAAEKCFREDHIEKYIDPDTGMEEERVVHRAYCGGRAMYADGWIPVEEITTLWKRMKRNHDKWEVEAMGSRPKAAGYVIKSQQKFKENITSKTGAELYMPGFPITITMDWGAIAAGLEVWQEQPGDEHALIEAILLEEAGVSQVLGAILTLRAKYPEFEEVAADIGGGGNYLNPLLAEEHFVNVRDVNFAMEKESAVAAWNILNEAGKIHIPEEHEDFITQVKRWKRKNGRIEKGQDHMCDSAVCYFAKFIDRLGTRGVRVPARSFSAATAGVEKVVRSGAHIPVVRPIARTLSGKRR